MPELNLLESIDLAKKYGIKFAKHKIVSDENQLSQAIEELGFPLVLKIVSVQFSHKTGVGGVKLNIDSHQEALDAFNALKTIQGTQKILVQEMLSGKELIVGGKLDEQFGATVLFGFGGVFVEILQDVSLRVCPLTKKDAIEMVSEIKAYPILLGQRGEKPVKLNELYELIMKTAKLMEKEKLKELDLNPVIANNDGIWAVDARIVK